MNGIQILLIAGVILLALYYAFRLRSALIDLVVLLLFSGAAIFFIIAPENTNKIAHKLGVGRGAEEGPVADHPARGAARPDGSGGRRRPARSRHAQG